MSNGRKLKILLLCAEAARHTGTVEDHIMAFKRFSRNDVFVLDAFSASKLSIDLSMFDAVVFHYSIVISMPAYLPEEFFQRLAAFAGPKILFIQDEFRWVNRTMAAAEKLGISVLFTVVNKDVIRKIYRDSYFDKVRFELTLTGFVPEGLIDREVPDYADRSRDLCYRARKLPGWCGSFALQKWQIGERFMKDTGRYGLNCDIAMSEASRIYGERWIDFVAGSKATLGTESGASFVDYTGEIHKAIDDFEAANPQAGFDEIRENFLEGRDGEVVIHVISPRCFEAACLRTLMILYPGDYSRALQPGRHFVELAPDHSNMDDVVAILRDAERAGEIIHNAYEEVAKSARWTHKAFIRHFDRVLDELAPQLMTVPVSADTIDADIVRSQADLLALQDAEHAEFEAAAMATLEAQNERLARRIRLKMQIVMFGQRIRFNVFRVTAALPRPISGPLLSFGRACTRTLTPIIKRVLLGRTD